MLNTAHNTIVYETVFSSPTSPGPSALWPAQAPIPFEPIYFSILKQVVPPALLRNQAPVLYQLPHPHWCYPQDLSGFFRRHKAHFATFLNAARSLINFNPQAVGRARTIELSVAVRRDWE